MNKLLVCFYCFVLFCLSNLVFAQDINIAVGDFTVEADNTSYKYLGKGISRLVANELGKASQIKLVERENMNKLLEEMDISLSDIASRDTQARIGQILSSQYLVMGELIEMSGDQILISVRMVEVETGTIVWQDTLQGKLSTYDYIGAFFAHSLLSFLDIKSDQSTLEKIEKQEEKKAEAIVKMSEGIDAFDKDNREKAKRALKESKKIDPQNDVTTYYLSKLFPNTTKFKIQPEPYFSYQNPAFLGILKTDRMHSSFSMDLANKIRAGGGSYGEGFLPIPGYPGSTYGEQTHIVNYGYYFPIGVDSGFGIELMWALLTNEGPARSRRNPIGTILNIGSKLSDSVSLGLGVSIYTDMEHTLGLINKMGGAPVRDIPPISLATNLGCLYRNAEETFVYDTRFGYTTGTTDEILPETQSLGEVIGLPLFWENNFTFAFNEKNTFLVLRQSNDVGLEQTMYFGSMICAIEQFFAEWFGGRIGLEGAYALLNDSNLFGYGFMGGSTFRIINWGLDLNLNFTYRKKPARAIEEMMISKAIIYFEITWNDIVRSR